MFSNACRKLGWKLSPGRLDRSLVTGDGTWWDGWGAARAAAYSGAEQATKLPAPPPPTSTLPNTYREGPG